jgi:ribosomal protein L37AE/L43A
MSGAGKFGKMAGGVTYENISFYKKQFVEGDTCPYCTSTQVRMVGWVEAIG